MEPKSPSKLKLSVTVLTQFKRGFKTGVVILVVLLLVFIGIFFATKSSYECDRHGRSFTGSYYTVVVDCGSSGTRISVFEWVLKDRNKRELPVLLRSYPDNSTEGSLVPKSSCKYHCLQTEPGLDKFVGNRSGVRASLEPLISYAEKIVPVERHVDTPIFVLATAGLRGLESEDASRVLDDIEAVVKERSFLCRRSWIRVLSGKEEAYYGWVALNYKMGILGNRSRSPTLGLLDLGGSSLQVVMEVNENVKEDTHFLRSRFGFVEHRILAYSLPAFGLNEAFDRTVVLLSHTEALGESSGGALELRHPCFGSYFMQNYTCHGCFGLNVTEPKNMGRAKENEYPRLQVVGVPNWERCKMLAMAVATNSSVLDWSRSMSGMDYKSRLCFDGGNSIRFHALSGFFAVYDTLNLSPKANMTKIWEKSRALCTSSWANDKSSVSSDHRYCFRVPYMASLIDDLLCLGDKEVVFGPADVSWSLGAALFEGEFLWLDNANARINTSASYRKLVSSPIFVFVVLVCLVSIVYRYQVKLPMLGKKSVVGSRESSHPYIYPRRRPN